MLRSHATILLASASIAGFVGGPARADEAAIVAAIEAFFQTNDTACREQIVARIEADPAYDRTNVSRWLHRAALFEPLEPGRRRIQVRLSNGSARSVVLRIPREYDHHKPWPLVYALHGSGGRGDDIIRYVEHILGDSTEEYVVAAPDRYEELIIHHEHWPPTGEHAALLLRLKQTVHVDSNRVYLAGYSRGGHATWTLAVLHADQFAAAMPLAGTFSLLLEDYMWEAFLPNLAHLPVLNVWGAGDIADGAGKPSPERGIAGVNRKLCQVAAPLGIPLTAVELPDRGHSNVVPPADELSKFFTHTRVRYPTSFQHTFRHICQARAYWIEGHQWVGDQWTDEKRTIRFREGEDPFSDDDFDNAVARTYRGLLGRLRGEINGQQLKVYRRKVKELTVWIGDGMIDWEKPVVLVASGRKTFEGRLDPDLYVCLSQAARTWDFDRLRWAGLRVKSRAKTRPVSPETEFPNPFDK